MKQIIIIAVIFLAAITLHQVNKERTEQKASLPVQEWCEVGTVNSDGSITYSSTEQYEELTAFITTSGPKLMAKCN